MQDLRLLPPWSAVGKFACNLVNELHCELHPEHPLWGCQCTPLAQRGDDVLFRVVNDREFLAVVHLTWSSSTESDIFPETTLYETLADWNAQMIQDNVAYEQG